MTPTEEKKPAIDAHDLDMVAFNSSKTIRAKNTIYAVDNLMQENYSTLKAALIPHLQPVIVVQSDGQGGTYTLINEGRTETVQPVAEIFQLMKSVSHTPLGIYVIIAPYLKQPEASDWIVPLEQFKAKLEDALRHINEVELPKDAVESCSKVLKGGIAFINNAVKDKKFTIPGFEQYTADVAAAIYNNMEHAAKAQIEGVEQLLGQWKARLGPEKWKKLYTIVLAIWTTEVKNQNWVILNRIMDQEMVDSHLITIGMASFDENTVAVALDNLARIVQDNIAAAMVFPTNPKLANALKGPEDLLSDAIEKMMGCPHHKEK